MNNTAHIRLAIMFAVSLIVAAALWFIDPATVKWLPACPLYALTGLSCPGCGSTRALHHLVHGELLAALRMNPLLVLMMVPLGYSLVREIPGLGRRLKPFGTSPAFAWAFLVVVVVFGIVRNIPAYPFTLLAPH